MPKTLKIETSRSRADSHSLNDLKTTAGLTLKQAAVIYFGGLSLLIFGLVVAGFAT